MFLLWLWEHIHKKRYSAIIISYGGCVLGFFLVLWGSPCKNLRHKKDIHFITWGGSVLATMRLFANSGRLWQQVYSYVAKYALLGLRGLRIFW